MCAHAGGVRTGGYPKAAPIPGPLGFQRPGDWDLLWSPARLALKALPYVKPWQLVSACPGLMSLTRKVRARYGAWKHGGHAQMDLPAPYPSLMPDLSLHPRSASFR